MKTSTANGTLLLVAIIWGSGFVTAQLSLDYGYLPFYMMGIRFTIAFAPLLIVLLIKVKTISKSTLVAGCLLGVFLFLGFAFQTVGLQYTTPSKNAFLTTANVVFIPILARILFKETYNRYVLAAAWITLAGMAFLTLDKGLRINIGDIYTIICAIMFALHILCVGHYVKNDHPVILTGIQLGVAAILSWSIALPFEEPPSFNHINGILAVAHLGFLSTLTAFFLQNTAQKYTVHTTASILLSTEAVFGTLFSMIFIGETMNIRIILGILLIAVGIVTSVTEWKFLKRNTTRPQPSHQ